MRPLHHPAIADVTLAGLLHALSDPVRLDIVRRLAAATCDLNCSAAAGSMDLPKSTLSHHFRILREAGVVRSERRGVQLCAKLRTEEIETRFPGLLAAILPAREAEAGGAAPRRRRAGKPLSARRSAQPSSRSRPGS
jgi:DNA-binding transcriptional ArsR family regulator